MREVYVAGIGMTSFSRLEYPLVEIAAHPAMGALRDAGLKKVDQVYVANMGSARINNQTALASAVVDTLGLTPAGAERIENGPASGASAVKQGFLGVASGMYETVLVIGCERMREVNNLEATDFVATLTHPLAEYIYGVTLPALAGMFTRLYMDRYRIRPEHLAMVAIKNHENGARNPKAHLRIPITMEGILTGPDAPSNNPWIAEPLRFFDCCPVSDGASAVLLAPAARAKDFKPKPVRVAGVGQATDTQAVHERSDPTELTAVRLAAEKAFAMAKLAPADIQVAELHDAFTILEIVESEEAGFFRKGEGQEALERGETRIGGRLPINPSGGLKSRGHPVGNTGVSQIVELTLQLRGEAGDYQVPNQPEHGFAVNFGGFGNNVIATVLERGA